MKITLPKDEKKAKIKLAIDRTDASFRVDDAIETPFWEFKKEANPAAITAESISKYVERRAEKLVNIDEDAAARIGRAVLTAIAREVTAAEAAAKKAAKPAVEVVSNPESDTQVKAALLEALEAAA